MVCVCAGGGSDSKKADAASWTVREQLILLDTVEARGFGNWEDIAKSFNADLGATNSNHPLYKSPQAARDHFGAVFLHGSMGRYGQYWHNFSSLFTVFTSRAAASSRSGLNFCEDI